MKKARIKQQNNKKDEKKVVSEEFSTKTKVITAIVLILTLVGFYLVTIKLVNDRKKNDPTSNKVEINVRRDMILIIQILRILGINHTIYY